MGNEFDGADSRAQPTNIQIVDLGVREAEDPDPRISKEPVRPDRRGLLLGGVLIACVFGGLTLLPSSNEAPAPEESAPAVEAVSACSALQSVEQREASRAAGQESPQSRDELPPGYIISGVTTAPDSTTLLGMVHPDGLFEVCEEAARDAPFTIDYLAEDELGELPDGMTYAYDWSSGVTDKGVTLDLEGVRLADGTVVDSLALPNGQTVPASQFR